MYPVLGDHDILVAGELVADRRRPARSRSAIEALWELPPGLDRPARRPSLTAGGLARRPAAPGARQRASSRQALAGPKVRVPPDPRGARWTSELEVHRAAASRRSAAPRASDTLDYARRRRTATLRLIVLDLARRDGGSGGLVRPDQPGWLASQLASRRRRAG